MRNYQLTFKLEAFDDNNHHKFDGYIDANSFEEVMHEFISVVCKRIDKEIPMEYVCDNIRDFNEERFGSTDVEYSVRPINNHSD